jgi:excisionase family DNA binding protein
MRHLWRTQLSTEPEKQYISIKESCGRYSIGQTRFRELLRQNKIEAVRLGSRVLVSVTSADAYFASLPRSNAG